MVFSPHYFTKSELERLKDLKEMIQHELENPSYCDLHVRSIMKCAQSLTGSNQAMLGSDARALFQGEVEAVENEESASYTINPDYVCELMELARFAPEPQILADLLEGFLDHVFSNRDQAAAHWSIASLGLGVLACFVEMGVVLRSPYEVWEKRIFEIRPRLVLNGSSLLMQIAPDRFVKRLPEVLKLLKIHLGSIVPAAIWLFAQLAARRTDLRAQIEKMLEQADGRALKSFSRAMEIIESD
jgi:hypothetical protein